MTDEATFWRMEAEPTPELVADVAAARWTTLREEITRNMAIEQELGDGYDEMATGESETRAAKHWGRAGALREVLAAMDRIEAE